MIIDCHVHFAGIGGVGGYISRKFKWSPSFLMMRHFTGHLFKKIDTQAVLNHLLETLNLAEKVDRAVFLALDEVYDAEGNPSARGTHLHAANDFVAGLARDHEKVLFGASVNPNRKDALEELERVAEMGAVLVKWLPSAQGIDCADTRFVPFYRKLADLGLPLLPHVGAEHTIPVAWGRRDMKELNHPERLELALDQGVKVVAAHCCLPVFWWDPDHSAEFLSLMLNYPNLYADVSALTLPSGFRARTITRMVGEFPPGRLLFGSDYPIPVNPSLRGWKGEQRERIKQAKAVANPMDRNLELLLAMGFHEQMFATTRQVLRLPAEPAPAEA